MRTVGSTMQFLVNGALTSERKRLVLRLKATKKLIKAIDGFFADHVASELGQRARESEVEFWKSLVHSSEALKSQLLIDESLLAAFDEEYPRKSKS